MLLFWISLALTSLFLELAAPGLFLFLSFTVGAVAGLCVYLFGFGIVIQLCSASIVTVISIAALYYKAKSLLSKHNSLHRTNVYALVGLQGIMISECRPEKFGLVKVDGQIWSCKPSAHHTITVNTQVRIIAIKGAHAVVEQTNHD